MRVGVIGNGVVVRDFLKALYKLKETRDVDCVAMLALRDEDMEAARALGAEFGITTVYNDCEAFLNDAAIDFVYIALPNAMHYEYALKALEHGKNVMCEKPFTSTEKQAGNLIETARQKHLMLFETITTIFFPNYKLIKEKLSEIGKVTLVDCNFSHVSSKYNALAAGKNPNVFNLEMGGGTMSDMNIYNIHFVLNMFGKPDNAVYFATKYKTGVDTSGMMVFDYQDMKAVCMSAKNCRGKNQMIIQGDKGYILCESGGNFIKGFKIIVGEEETSYNIQDDLPRLYYELETFESMFREKAYAQCYELLDYTRMVVGLCERARKNAGIYYPADKD